MRKLEENLPREEVLRKYEGSLGFQAVNNRRLAGVRMDIDILALSGSERPYPWIAQDY
jgi:hypothetical protein